MPHHTTTDRTSRPLEWMASILASVTIGFAVLALAGWMFSDPDLAAFGTRLVPMAPSTAALFLVLSSLVLLRGRLSGPARFRRLVLVTAGVATLSAAALLVLSSLGVALGLEHLGFSISGRRAGVLIGHMSPLTALAFVAAGSSLLLAGHSGRRHVLVGEIASLLAALVVLTGGIAALAYAMGGPLLYGSGIIPPALPTSLAFVLLGGAVWATCRTRISPGPARVPSPGRRSYAALALFSLLGAGVVAAAVLQFRQYEATFQQGVTNQLESVAELKLDQLETWRQERMLDAVAFFRNPSFSELVQELFADPGAPEPQRLLRGWLSGVQEGFQYDRVSILDSAGQERLAVGSPADGWSPRLTEELQRVLRRGQPELLDLHALPPRQGSPSLAVLAPVVGSTLDGPIAALAIHIDPDVYLYPMLRRWPVRSTSGETLLVRQQGDKALVLNHQLADGSAPYLYIPMARRGIAAVMAAGGAHGVVQAQSVDGTDVTAAVRALPGTDWFLVVQMATGELYASLNERLWWTLGLVGALLLVLGASARITWHLREERYLRQLAGAEERYRSLFNSIRDAIVIADTGRRIIDCNPAFEELFGYPRDEILGELTVAVYESPEEYRRMGEQIRAHMDTPGFVHVIRYRKKSGETFPGETSAFYLRDPAGDITGFIGLIRDVSDRLRAEEQRERLQARLFETDKMETVGRLAGGVAHDFNNALAAILGHVELAIAQVEEDGQLRADLGQIRTAAERAADVVRQLLTFARRQVIRPEILDLNATVDDLLEMLSTLVERKVDVRWRPGDGLWPVRMDPAQLEQLLANLVLNAHDATAGKGTIVIRTGNVTVDPTTGEAVEGKRPGPYVMLSVSDDGVGMDEETLDKVFDPFFSTKPTSEGGGLGLAAVHGIVRQHDGFIEVQSTPGQGATFEIYLPRTEGEPRT